MFVLALSLYNTWNRGVFLLCKITNLLIYRLNIKEPYQAGDYLYYFGGTDDVWLGLWGIIRVYDKYQNCLKPLCKGKVIALYEVKIKNMSPIPCTFNPDMLF